MEYHSAIKKNEVMPLAATWMDLESLILSQEEKGKYNMTSLRWNLKYDANELIYKAETDSYRKLTYVTKGKRMWGSSRRGAAEMNPTRNREAAGSTLAQWAGIQCCCGCGISQQLQLEFDPLPGNFHMLRVQP